MEIIKKTFQKFVSEFNKIEAKQKLGIIVLLIVAFTVGLSSSVGYLTFLFPQENQKVATKPKALPTPIPSPAALSIISDKTSIAAGSTFSAQIKLNSYNQGIEAADFDISFDPKYLKVATISSGAFFGAYPRQETTTNSILISAMAQVSDEKIIIPKGEGVVADIIFEALNPVAQTIVAVNKNNTIVASDGKNVLDKVSDLTISIK